MTDAQKLKALIDEFFSLDSSRDSIRMRQILEEAIPEVDRTTKPKKWAELHRRLGQLREGADFRGALQAYRKALEVWTPEEDHEKWVVCHSGAGRSLFALQPLVPEDVDEAITHLEAAEPDEPFLAAILATLYQKRQHGDPLENWRNRMKQLELAQAQISREKEPVKWATAENELAVATEEEPDGDFFPVRAKSRQRHLAALAALGDDRGDEYIKTCIYLSEFTDIQRKVEEYAHRALEAAKTLPSAELTAKAQLAVGNAISMTGRKEGLKEALKYYGDASAIYHRLNKLDLKADAMKHSVNAKAQLIKLGEKEYVESMVKDAEDAELLLDPQFDGQNLRIIFQMEGEALLDADQPERAVGCFERAVSVSREALAQATTPEGRRELIWEFHNSSALLSFCYLQMEREEDALQALEDGKGKFWSAADKQEKWEGVSKWIPPGGALLFPNFARDRGAVIVVTASGRTVVWLPDFGRKQLLELKQGAVEPKQLGGWLNDYPFKDGRHEDRQAIDARRENWRRAINSIGETLYNQIWSPVIAALPALGVGEGAELVWFPQGGSGLFPMHAAWRTEKETRKWLLDDYAIRYAPSIKALAAAAQKVGHGEPESGENILVIDPLENLEKWKLEYSQLEGAWALRQLGTAQTQVLRGPAATKAAFLAAVGGLGGARWIHLSTHARFNWERPLQFVFDAGRPRGTHTQRITATSSG